MKRFILKNHSKKKEIKMMLFNLINFVIIDVINRQNETLRQSGIEILRGSFNSLETSNLMKQMPIKKF